MNAAFTAHCLLLLSVASAQASDNRGVWFWGDSGSPYGSIAIVGDPVEETKTIAFLTSNWVKRVYGSYQNRPVSHPGTIAAWNASLDGAGLDSQCLFSDNHLMFPAVFISLLSHHDDHHEEHADEHPNGHGHDQLAHAPAVAGVGEVPAA
jgi:hypothetical protein